MDNESYLINLVHFRYFFLQASEIRDDVPGLRHGDLMDHDNLHFRVAPIQGEDPRALRDVRPIV